MDGGERYVTWTQVTRNRWPSMDQTAMQDVGVNQSEDAKLVGGGGGGGVHDQGSPRWRQDKRETRLAYVKGRVSILKSA